MLSDRIPSKADIRLIRSLGQKKFREELGLFVVEGEKMVGEALTQKRYQVEAVTEFRTAPPHCPPACVSGWTLSATREMSGPSCVWPTGSE